MGMDKVNVMSDSRELHWAEVNPGLADQYRAEALSTRKILGLREFAQNVSPSDIEREIKYLQKTASTSGEEVWEKAMMAAIGEDGPKSVADAIGRLKAGSVPEGWTIEKTLEGSIAVSHLEIGFYISRFPSDDSRISEILLHALATDLQQPPRQEPAQ
jgi:hypothetical protein